MTREWGWRESFWAVASALIVVVLALVGGLTYRRLDADTSAQLALRDACGRVEAQARACGDAVAQCGALLAREREGWRSVRVDAAVCGQRATWVHYGPGGPRVSCDAEVRE